MSYRSDQEAALARLDALAAEHARLLAENQELRAKRKPVRAPSTVPVNDEPLPRFAVSAAVVLTVLAIAFIAYALAT
jgi:hypothetical protein